MAMAMAMAMAVAVAMAMAMAIGHGQGPDKGPFKKNKIYHLGQNNGPFKKKMRVWNGKIFLILDLIFLYKIRNGPDPR